jgi:chorismate synthase
MLRYLTAGESHGPMLTAILEGIPANLSLVAEEINLDLGRRQRGYGRGGRMRIEKDEANIVGGVRHGLTMGGPIAILIANRDWENWN